MKSLGTKESSGPPKLDRNPTDGLEVVIGIYDLEIK